MKQRMLRTVALLLLLAVSLSVLVGCGDSTPQDATKLSFKAALGFDYLKSLNGKPVTINGYMATSSPVDGSFMFLMNLPYQSCPFCVPNTSQLSNTMEIYPKKGESFAYTNQAIRVTGTLVVADSEDEPFTDMYGYEFSYKIVDATYTVIKASELSADMALWQKIAQTDVVTELYRMYDYVNFLCAWPTYFVNSYVDKSGNTQPGYYLYASDALGLIRTDGKQYNYGYKDGYFDTLVAKVEAVDKTAFADLVKNIRDAEALAARALSDLENGRYSSEYTYVEKFGTEDYVYTLDNGEALVTEMNALYSAFSLWLSSWEL